MGIMWVLCGDYVRTMWRLCEDYVATMWGLYDGCENKIVANGSCTVVVKVIKPCNYLASLSTGIYIFYRITWKNVNALIFQI